MSTKKNHPALTKKRPKAVDPRKLMLAKQALFGFLIFIGLGLLGVGIWYVSHLPALSIAKITITGGETVATSALANIIESELNGSYFHLVPKRFAWLYPEKKILAKLYEVEKIKSVTLDRVSGTEIAVQFTEHIPSALWCESKTASECWFIDQAGLAFMKAPTLSGEALVKYVTLGRAPQKNSVLASSDDIKTIDWLIYALEKQAKFLVTTVEIDLERDIYFTLAEGSEIKATLLTLKEQTLENLLVILQSENYAHLKPGNFKYIDLRFGNKAFVNEEINIDSGVSSTTASSSTATSTPL